MTNRNEISRRTFIQLAGLALVSTIPWLTSCSPSQPPSGDEQPGAALTGAAAPPDATTNVQQPAAEAPQASPDVSLNAPIDLTAITSEYPVEGLEVRKLKLNDFFTVTFLVTEHYPEDAQNKDKMHYIKEAIEGSSCVVPEYWTPAIEEMRDSAWVKLMTKPGDRIISFFSRIYDISLRFEKPVWVLDPANRKSFMDVAGQHAFERFSDDEAREKESIYRNTLNAAFLVALANKYEAENSKQNCAYVLPKAHADQIMDLIFSHNPPEISLKAADDYYSISPTNRTENMNSRIDQYTARQYIPSGDGFIERDTISLLL
ncbi:MAG: hypothetical protein UV73_C0008G0025 [Candidatus Gottesmanbacteria bacterium GW2011_GWA2_43_14]|uniref:Uncharacterized protein n=1 Tax=Candidatus Gottesmanbacteria bacterium GW2011_GWA2_43_14 TaxID=1618443 RepID=A0A0G1DI41_9BACT|nr:MAG: hypothetical protein UV73_C0008G0025 [Candidatus Gottesmanbacteria bacterium GW2011_GWA2_43_14]